MHTMTPPSTETTDPILAPAEAVQAPLAHEEDSEDDESYVSSEKPEPSEYPLLKLITNPIEVTNEGMGVGGTGSTLISPFPDYDWFNKANNGLTATNFAFFFATTYVLIARNEREAKALIFLNKLKEKIVAKYVERNGGDRAQVLENLDQLLIDLMKRDSIRPTQVPLQEGIADPEAAIQEIARGLTDADIAEFIREDQDIALLFELWKKSQHTPILEKGYQNFSLACYAFYVAMYLIAQAAQDGYQFIYHGKGNLTINNVWIGIAANMLAPFLLGVVQFAYGMKEDSREKFPKLGKILDFAVTLSTYIFICLAVEFTANLELDGYGSLARWLTAIIASAAKTAFASTNGKVQFIEDLLSAAALNILSVPQTTKAIFAWFYSSYALSMAASVTHGAYRYFSPITEETLLRQELPEVDRSPRTVVYDDDESSDDRAESNRGCFARCFGRDRNEPSETTALNGGAAASGWGSWCSWFSGAPARPEAPAHANPYGSINDDGLSPVPTLTR